MDDGLLGMVGLAVSVGLFSFITWANTARKMVQDVDPVSIEERIERNAPEQPRMLYVSPESDCSVDRLQLALDRWVDAGWPRATIVTQPYDGALHVVSQERLFKGHSEPDLLHGGVGFLCHDTEGVRDCLLVMAIRETSCGIHNPAVEHELGHGLYALPHTERLGWVMSVYYEDTDLRFPRPGKNVDGAKRRGK